MDDGKWLDRCLFSVCVAHMKTNGIKRHFTAELVGFDEENLFFQDSSGEVTAEDRRDVVKITPLASERYGKYNHSSLH